MYRLINLNKLTATHYRLLTVPKYNNIEAEKCGRLLSLQNFSCYLCNKNNLQNLINKLPVSSIGIHAIQYVSVNTLSTDYLAKTKLLKKRRKKKKKFTELLEVTAASTTETKTTVKNLKAKSLSDFITATPSISSDSYQKIKIDMLESNDALKCIVQEDCPVIFVDQKSTKVELRKEDLKEIYESFNNHKEMIMATELEEPHEEEVIEELEHIEDLHILPEPNLQRLPKNIQGKYKSKMHRSADDEIKHKIKALHNSLMSYLDICVSSGMVNRGLSTVQNYRFKYKKHNSKFSVIDIELYNILISGFAEKGNWSKIKEVLRAIQEDDIKCTPQTFAGIFECLGRIETTEDVQKDIERYVNKANQMGISLNDIMDKSKFVNDKREIVLATIQSIEPTFEPIYSQPPFLYSNSLVNQLNERVQPIDVEPSTHKSDDKKVSLGFNIAQLMELTNDQLKYEMDGYVTIKSVAKVKNVTPKIAHYRKKIDELNTLWNSQICAAFHRDLNSLRAQASSQNLRAMNLFPYLKALEVRQYAEILLREIRILADGSETYSPTVLTLYRDLGRKVQSRYQLEKKKRNGTLDKMRDLYANYCSLMAEHESTDNSRQCWQRLAYHNCNEGPNLDIVEKPWPMAAQVGVGKFLYNILMRDLKIDTNMLKQNSKASHLLPAFYSLYRYHGKNVKQEVKPHPTLIKLYRGSQQENLIFDANLVPMVCPPLPWTDENHGGYLLTKSDLIRLPYQAVQQLSRVSDMPKEHLFPALDSLNQLANVPWKVNGDILDIVIKVFNDGGCEKLEVPQPASALPIPPELLRDKSELSQEDKIKNFKLKLQHKRKQAEMYSLWCDALYRLSLANHFRDKPFWLPHNMDFRGRVYPVPPHLSHLGSDLARSLLVFNKTKPLGVDGFAWLKLHCINLTGFKKRDSVRERLLYAEQIMDDILDSAENPLTGRMWWAKSDEPWQTLAACIEIAKVHKCPDPAEFMSSFPIHQDGSCNGLQHYAALGRDSAGAYSVNLSAADAPQDVYSDIASLVEAMRKKDAENGVEVAKVLDGFVRRKVIKQTVMTTVYGVTRYGARLQIAKQLKDIDEFPKDFVWQASSYLTTKTFESLREMFKSTKEIQDWFTECARQISSVRGSNVEWYTPLGLPVVQPYNRSDRKHAVKSDKLTSTSSMDLYEKPNIMKQKNAFPPNFIHSLDSSHMMLTSLHCEQEGLTFVSVHDCFWTHACTVPEMNKICRKQFVALHSQPILEDLSQFLVKTYSYTKNDFRYDGSVTDMQKQKLNQILKQVPQKGDFDLNNVLQSVYFFS